MGKLVGRFQADYLKFPCAKFQVSTGPPIAFVVFFFRQ